jgi:hypothetical protein
MSVNYSHSVRILTPVLSKFANFVSGAGIKELPFCTRNALNNKALTDSGKSRISQTRINPFEPTFQVLSGRGEREGERERETERESYGIKKTSFVFRALKLYKSAKSSRLVHSPPQYFLSQYYKHVFTAALWPWGRLSL